MANRRWRPLAAASVVTAALAGAVVLRAVLEEDTPDAPADAAPTTGTSVTAGASASPEPGAVLTAADPVLEKRAFAAGEQVTVKHGIGFLSAADGSLETWSQSGPNPNPFGVHATPDGALLVSYPTAGEPTSVVERATGKTWKVSPDVALHLEMAHGTVLAVSLASGERRQPALIDVVTGKVTTLGESLAPDETFQGVASPDGRRLAVQRGNEVDLIEFSTGRVTPLAEDVPQDGFTHVVALPGALGFTVAPTGADGPRRWFSWDGVEIERELGSGAVSPGGRYIARAWSPGRIKAGGMGGYPVVGAITIEERQSGKPLVRFLGAEPLPFPERAWSAAGDSLVIQVPEGYRVMSASGSTISTISDDIHVLDPRPSPTTPGLLGTNRGTIINVARGLTIAPVYAELPWRARWNMRPGELVVDLATPGKGRSWPVDVMPFDVRSRDLDGPPQIEVDNDTDSCAPIRSRPEAGAAEVECMPDGLRGKITEADDPFPDPKPSGEPAQRYAGIRDRDNTAWFHLEMEDGATGWARVEDLAWAD